MTQGLTRSCPVIWASSLAVQAGQSYTILNGVFFVFLASNKDYFIPSHLSSSTHDMFSVHPYFYFSTSTIPAMIHIHSSRVLDINFYRIITNYDMWDFLELFDIFSPLRQWRSSQYGRILSQMHRVKMFNDSSTSKYLIGALESSKTCFPPSTGIIDAVQVGCCGG